VVILEQVDVMLAKMLFVCHQAPSLIGYFIPSRAEKKLTNS